VLKELQARFQYMMVDEFQDTNWAQYELIKLLAGEKKNLTVVGDDDQSIYKFRGASLANILQFRDDFPNCATVTLTENYRSNQEVLDAAYECITKNNPNRLEVRLASSGLVKKLNAAKGAGGDVSVSWHRTIEDEAEGVAQKIRGFKETDPELRWSDIAILSRSNDGAEPFIRALERHGIPFRFFALRGLYAKPEVVNITALFSLLDGTRESPAVWRLMASPIYGFPARDISTLLQFANKKRGRSSLGSAMESVRAIPGVEPEGSEARRDTREPCPEPLRSRATRNTASHAPAGLGQDGLSLDDHEVHGAGKDRIDQRPERLRGSNSPIRSLDPRADAQRVHGRVPIGGG
jgi:superfamily I DNA/RNA helicase